MGNSLFQLTASEVQDNATWNANGLEEVPLRVGGTVGASSLSLNALNYYLQTHLAPSKTNKVDSIVSIL